MTKFVDFIYDYMYNDCITFREVIKILTLDYGFAYFNNYSNLLCWLEKNNFHIFHLTKESKYDIVNNLDMILVLKNKVILPYNLLLIFQSLYFNNYNEFTYDCSVEVDLNYDLLKKIMGNNNLKINSTKQIIQFLLKKKIFPPINKEKLDKFMKDYNISTHKERPLEIDIYSEYNPNISWADSWE